MKRRTDLVLGGYLRSLARLGSANVASGADQQGLATMDKMQMNALLNELKAGAALASGSRGAAKAGPQPVDFSALLRGTLDQVNGSQEKSQALAREFQLGNPKVSLEDTMVALQKSSLSFQFLVQVRNKVVTAYHDIMNMPV